MGVARPVAGPLRWVQSLESLSCLPLAFYTGVFEAGNRLPRLLMGEQPEEIVLAEEISALTERAGTHGFCPRCPAKSGERWAQQEPTLGVSRRGYWVDLAPD